MKKTMLFAAVLVVLATLTMLGCGSDNDSITLTFNVPANANQIRLLREDLSQFEERFGARVKLFPFTGQEKLYAMMAAGQAPDIFYTNTVVRDQLAAEGRLLDLYSVAEGDSFIHRIRPEFVQRGTSIDGGWYQFCDWTFTYAVYYNKILFERAGLAEPALDWNWSDLVRSAKALTVDADSDGSPEQYGIFIAKHFAAALEQMNGARFQRNALFFSLSDESRQALQAYLDLMNRHHVMPDVSLTQAQGMQMTQLLNSGRTAMAVEALPNPDVIAGLKIDWDVAPLPRMGDNPPAYFRSASGGLSISAGCPHPDIAWEFLKWLITESRYNTPNPILRDVDFVGDWEKTYPVLAQTRFGEVWRLSEQYDGGDPRDFVRYSSWSSAAILEILAPKMDLLFSGKIDVDQLAAAEADINRNVERELLKLQQSALDSVFLQQIKSEINARRGEENADR
ncbi:extracellular solute-binding protein [candidate division KSB1 bacterium]|nr:extracellular solute-binding protein [candidate division KSB1 bacterium]